MPKAMFFMGNKAASKKPVRAARNPGTVVVSGKYAGKSGAPTQDRSEKLRAIALDAEKRLKGSMKLLS